MQTRKESKHAARPEAASAAATAAAATAAAATTAAVAAAGRRPSGVAAVLSRAPFLKRRK